VPFIKPECWDLRFLRWRVQRWLSSRLSSPCSLVGANRCLRGACCLHRRRSDPVGNFLQIRMFVAVFTNVCYTVVSRTLLVLHQRLRYHYFSVLSREPGGCVCMVEFIPYRNSRQWNVKTKEPRKEIQVKRRISLEQAILWSPNGNSMFLRVQSSWTNARRLPAPRRNAIDHFNCTVCNLIVRLTHNSLRPIVSKRKPSLLKLAAFLLLQWRNWSQQLV
jgi:hypothetical protein